MSRYYITSAATRSIVPALTEDAARMLFSLAHPGMNIDLCLKMANN